MPLLEGFDRLAPLLAQRSNWSRLGDRFSGEHLRLQTEDVVGAVLLIAAGVIGYFLLNYLAKWQRETRGAESPRRLFATLSDAHRLNREERRVCRRVANEHGLKEPAELFVRIDLRAALAAENADLARRLFG